MIKMLVTDIDGTIYSPVSGISDNVKNCIKKLEDNGILVVIATGRTFGSARHIADLIGIKCPLVCYQGGLVNSYDGKILDVKYLDQKIAREIICECRNRNIHLNVYVEDTLYVENDDNYIKDYIGDKGIDYFKVNSFDELDFSKLTKLLAIKYDKKFIDDLINEFRL
ncbi:MAG: HAD family hydrolase, partial [Candidatus Gastranaerophilales bacterium]|nr:HAD family hydrolase [Candidatus Gastranaerophilales bacterium]